MTAPSEELRALRLEHEAHTAWREGGTGKLRDELVAAHAAVDALPRGEPATPSEVEGLREEIKGHGGYKYTIRLGREYAAQLESRVAALVEALERAEGKFRYASVSVCDNCLWLRACTCVPTCGQRAENYAAGLAILAAARSGEGEKKITLSSVRCELGPDHVAHDATCQTLTYVPTEREREALSKSMFGRTYEMLLIAEADQIYSILRALAAAREPWTEG